MPMIVGEIRRYLRDNSALRISRSMRDTAYKILRAREALLVETQREPTVEQLARYLDIPREDVVFAMDAFSDPVSFTSRCMPTAGTRCASWTRCGTRRTPTRAGWTASR